MLFARPSELVSVEDKPDAWPWVTIRGGGAGRALRPATSPRVNRIAPAIRGTANRDFRKRRPQSLQNRLLVQICHRARTICAPHSAQKFGLYIVRNSDRKGPRRARCSLGGPSLCEAPRSRESTSVRGFKSSCIIPAIGDGRKKVRKIGRVAITN